jgi:hypothetical protein
MLNCIIFISILWSSIIEFDEVAAFQGYQQDHLRERRPLRIRLGLAGHQQQQSRRLRRRLLLSPLPAALLSSTDQYLNNINNGHIDHSHDGYATPTKFSYHHDASSGFATAVNGGIDRDRDTHNIGEAVTNLPQQQQGVYQLTSEDEYKYEQIWIVNVMMCSLRLKLSDRNLLFVILCTENCYRYIAIN